MAVEATYRRMTPAEFEQVLAAVGRAQNVFDPAAPDSPGCLDEFEAVNAVGKVFRLGKEWHALHFLLTGDASLDPPSPVPPPLGNVVHGGTPTPIEGTYGPVRCLRPEEVREVADALGAIPVEELRRRFDAQAFNERAIYPNPGPGGWDEWELESLLELYPKLVDFFRRAADAGELVLISVD